MRRSNRRHSSFAWCGVVTLLVSGAALADPQAEGGTGFTTGQRPSFTTGQAPSFTTGQSPSFTTGTLRPTAAPPPPCGAEQSCVVYFPPYDVDAGGPEDGAREVNDTLGTLDDDE